MSISIAAMNLINRIECDVKELRARLAEIESTLLDQKIKEQEQITKVYTARQSKQARDSKVEI